MNIHYYLCEVQQEEVMEGDIETLIRGERDFLHDVANQLVVAQGMSTILKSKLSKDETFNPEYMDKQMHI